MHVLRPGKAAFFLSLLGFSQSGCDIVQGFRDASSAIFPEEKTYFDAPGFRLLRGGYRGLEFASGSSLYLLARSAEPGNTSLYSMFYADPRPCSLPNVKNHRPSEGTFKDVTTIAFIEEGMPRGTLRFATGDCQLFDLALEQSTLPFAELPEGFVIFQGSDIVLVNPVTGTTRKIVGSAAFAGSFDAYYVIYSGGRAGVFRGYDWKEIGWFGDQPVGGSGAGRSFYFEDRSGIHKLAASGSDPPVTDTVIAPGGCKLGFPRPLGAAESWVAYHAPCAEQKLIAYGDTSQHASVIGIAADPRYLAFMPAPPKVDGDPAVDPFFTFYLADLDEGTGLGTLVMRPPDRRDRKLGSTATLDRVTFLSPPTGTFGYALVDVDGDVGRYVRWDGDGNVRELAQNVFRGTGDLIVDYDGKTGSFALPSENGINIVAQRVPPRGFKFRDAKNRWTAMVSDYEDSMGTLSISESSLDFGEAAHTPGPAPSLETIIRGVHWDWRTQFVASLPGIAYLINHDAKQDTGRLDYRNLEIRFTATVSDGVSDYLPTTDGLIYSVPFGDGAGIWHVRSR